MSATGLSHFDASTRALVGRRVRAVLRALGVASDAIDVTFVDDAEIRVLNAQYRGKDRPTDVLSFPFDDDGLVDALGGFFGDLVISADTARAQARQLGHTIDVEVAVLVAHGALHLLGFDHERGAEDARAQAEAELMVLDAARVPLACALIGRAFAARPRAHRATRQPAARNRR